MLKDAYLGSCGSAPNLHTHLVKIGDLAQSNTRWDCASGDWGNKSPEAGDESIF